MVKRILLIAFLVLFNSGAFAADVWTYRVDSVDKTSSAWLLVTYTLRLNNADYVSNQVEFAKAQFEGKTNEEKIALVKTEIVKRCNEIIGSYKVLKSGGIIGVENTIP